MDRDQEREGWLPFVRMHEPDPAHAVVGGRSFTPPFNSGGSNSGRAVAGECARSSLEGGRRGNGAATQRALGLVYGRSYDAKVDCAIAGRDSDLCSG